MPRPLNAPLGRIVEAFVIGRVFSALFLAALMSGCTNVLKAGYPARSVQIQVSNQYASDVTLRIGKSGEMLRPNAAGVYEVELPEIPRRCDTYLFYPGIPWQRYPVPQLFVMKGDHVLRRVSVIQVHHDAESSAMPMELPLE